MEVWIAGTNQYSVPPDIAVGDWPLRETERREILVGRAQNLHWLVIETTNADAMLDA